jgi:hypothetical protein
MGLLFCDFDLFIKGFDFLGFSAIWVENCSLESKGKRKEYYKQIKK